MDNSSFVKKISSGVIKKLQSIFKNPYREVNLNWFRLKYYKHLPAGTIRKHNLFNHPIYFSNPAELIHAFDEIFVDEIYKQQLSNQPYIIDCGANIGLSIIYMKQHYPDANIVAFEPDEKNFNLLSKNIQSFNYNNVILRQEAVWVEDTTLQFSNEGSMSSKIEFNNNKNVTPVKATRLYNLLNKEIDFLKIDIEGAEFAVLNDIADKLILVKNLFIEYHGSFDQNIELSKLIVLITTEGFHFYIKEAASIYKTPFYRSKNPLIDYDVQLNIFCFR